MKHSAVRVLALGAAAALALTGTSACTSDRSDDPVTSLTMRVFAIPDQWNPLTGAGMINYPGGQAVYEPLIMESAPGKEYIPWLAKEYEFAADGHSLSLELRDDVDFVDGTHMDAAGVAEYLEAYFDSPGGAADIPYDLDIEVTGDYALEITAALPLRGAWFERFAAIPIVSAEAINDLDTLASTPAGTGPYIIDDAVPEVSINFVRNPNYWNPEAFDFDEVEMQIIPDEIAALNAVKSGQISVTQLDQIANAIEAENSGLVLYEGASLYPSLFIIDRLGETNPAFGDVRVRRAINLAMDREGINDALNQGRGRVSSEPFAAGTPLYVEGGEDRYAYDLEEARALMAEAGYADGFDVVIPVVNWTTPFQPVVEQSLADIGIRVQWEPNGDDLGKLFFEQFPSGKYPIALYTFQYGQEITWIEQFWRGMLDPHAQELRDVIASGTNDEAAEAGKELGEYILDQAWYVPFSSPPTYVAASPEIHVEVKGLVTNPKLWQYTLAA
jgi:peptide/nickel transport system substrate-binding protein